MELNYEMASNLVEMCVVCIRIMNPVDGTEVYQDAAAREQCKQSWMQILNIMDAVGFKPDVNN